jgi:hypothetical protein
MTSSRVPDAIPLTGADCFLRAFDSEARRYNHSSHLAQLVLRLGPGLDPEALGRRIVEAAAANPLLSAPIGRRFGVGAPEYRTRLAPRCAPPRLQVHRADAPAVGAPGEAPVPPVFFERLNDRFDLRRGDLLRLDLVVYPDATADLAFTWLHMLLDGSGSERFVRWLDAYERGEADADAPSVTDAELRAKQAAIPVASRDRGQQAMRWQRFLHGMAQRPPRSLAGGRRRVPQDLRYRAVTLDPAQTRVITERASTLAGFLTPMLFYLAASIRAHAAVFEARNQRPESYVIPLPVNLRAKGGAGATFRTHVSLVWFQVTPDQVGDLEELIAELKAQRRRVIKEGLIEAGTAAMDFARYAPSRLYAAMARRTLRGELCSFFFAYTDQFLPGMDRFFGAEIRGGFPAPSVPASPGSGAIVCLRGDRLNFTHIYQRSAIRDDELDRFRDRFLRDLLGTP